MLIKRILLAILSILAILAGYMVYIRYVDTSVISVGIAIDPNMQTVHTSALKTDGKTHVTLLGDHSAPLDDALKWLLEAQEKGIQALNTTPTVCVEAYRLIICQLMQKLGLKPNAVHVIGVDRFGKLLAEKMNIISVDSLSEDDRQGRLFVQALINKPLVILTCENGATITVMRDNKIQKMEFDTVDNMISHVYRIDGKVPLTWILLGDSWQNPVLRQHVTKVLKQTVSTNIDVKTLEELGYNPLVLPTQILAYMAARRLKKSLLSKSGSIYQPDKSYVKK